MKTKQKPYTITRCSESWEFATHQAAVAYGQKLTTVYGEGSSTDGTAVFMWSAGRDKPTQMRRSRNVFEAYPEK